MLRSNYSGFRYSSALSVAFCVACLAFAGQYSPTSVFADETMSANLASRMGLETAWQRQIQVPAGAASIVDQQIYVHQSEPHEYVEVVATMKRPDAETGKEETYESVLRRISVDEVDRYGNAIGKKEAERLASNEVRRLTHRKVDAKVTSKTVPRICLYTLSDDGTLECRDAETGSPVWLSRVGNRHIGYSKIGIDDQFLTVINGGNLIKLNAKDGAELESIRTTTMPLFGAIHAGEYSMVPTIRNGIVGYPLSNDKREAFTEVVAGLALAPPSKSPNSTKIAWGTNRGYVYVMESEGTPSILFRLNTDGIVSGRVAAASGDYFYFGSESGQVYGIQASREGKVVWSRPYGEPFYNSPMIAGDKVLLRSTYGNLYCLGTADGIMVWEDTVSNIDELLAVFDGKVFVRLLSGGLSVIDLESGKTISVTNDVLPTRLLANSQTNRLYLVSQTGAVQCLRPTGAVLPTFNESKSQSASSGSTDPMASDKEPEGPSGAFAGQGQPKDPFGASAAPAAAGGDPFGAGAADPFGAAGGDAMADPFGGGAGGGGADPFADPFGN
ncbi:PQQ-binding-like beta-propeller repeat protein [Stieleria marina]|uniref:Outer membrane biogenesis protein BamB n=1 Tax=Stieleria marina TaxID=1930275 RepID=A0A517NYJ3_9BACT|nr:outer membrane biogenesis protein BamB [Planctomycetes bacterium K23_9]